MKGHIILNRRNKEGYLYVPEAEIRLRASPGGRLGWLDVYTTDGMRYDMKTWPPKPIMPIVDWLKENFDFAVEVDVSEEMINWARQERRKKDRQIESMSNLLEDTFKTSTAPLDADAAVATAGFKKMEHAVLRVTDIMDFNAPTEVPVAKKYAMALQIQHWIHEAGGLC